MDITIKSLKFNADQKLIDYINKKVARLEKFHDDTVDVEVTLSLLQELANKNVKIQMHTPGESHLVERHAETFEEAVTKCVDTMKEKLTRSKEKRQQQ